MPLHMLIETFYIWSSMHYQCSYRSIIP